MPATPTWVTPVPSTRDRARLDLNCRPRVSRGAAGAVGVWRAGKGVQHRISVPCAVEPRDLLQDALSVGRGELEVPGGCLLVQLGPLLLLEDPLGLRR